MAWAVGDILAAADVNGWIPTDTGWQAFTSIQSGWTLNSGAARMVSITIGGAQFAVVQTVGALSNASFVTTTLTTVASLPAAVTNPSRTVGPIRIGSNTIGRDAMFQITTGGLIQVAVITGSASAAFFNTPAVYLVG